MRAKGYCGNLAVIPQFGVDSNHPSTSLRTSPTTEPPNHPTTQPFRIGYAGRLVPEKGVDILLRAVARLSGDWQLCIVGSGPELPRLQALTRELHIESRVRFDTARLSAEMPAWYSQIDLVVQPSLTRPNWKEQFNRVLIEAMASEVPAVCSSCGEMPNVIGDAGIVFPEGDAAALCDCIDALMRDPSRRAELGKRGRARVLEHFTQARVAEETYAVYRKMLSKPD